MNEAGTAILTLRQQVMRRKRLLAVQDSSVLGLIAGGAVVVGASAAARFGVIGLTTLTVILIGAGVVVLFAVAGWVRTAARDHDAVREIDDALGLEDRVTTSCSVLELGRPARPFEQALIEETEKLIGGRKASSIVNWRFQKWYWTAVAAVLVAPAAVWFGPRVASPEKNTESAIIKEAGEQLEAQTAEIEQSLPKETKTAQLAVEQRELGRAFRSSRMTKVEALRRLSSLEEKIKSRREELKATRAEEIVDLAEQRFSDVVASAPVAKRTQLEESSNPETTADAESAQRSGKQKLSYREKQPGNANAVPDQTDTDLNRNPESPKTGKQTARNVPSNRLQERISSTDRSVSGEGKPKTPSSVNSNSETSRNDKNEAAKAEKRDGAAKPDAAGKPDEGADQSSPASDADKKDEKPGAADALKSLPGSIAEKAAKTFPKLSEELLKKAAQLRADQLSPSDIEKLRAAAESLSRSLAEIPQSQELRQELEKLGRQVSAEQMERVAGELQNHEQLKQELQSAARLLGQNQKAKQTVAGLAGQIARDDGKQGNRAGNGGSGSTNPQSRASDSQDPHTREPVKSDHFEKPKTPAPGGAIQSRQAGEYLYLQTHSEAGAARVPYSSAYPQYRREAERSVQRSQVPAGFRLMVRKYFDSINPDSRK